MMNVLLLGATGATGKLLLRILLKGGHHVMAPVRSPEKVPEDLSSHTNLTLLTGTVLDMSKRELVTLLKDCDGVASCLGHNISFRGIFGKPRRLVRDSIRKVTSCIDAANHSRPVRVILMNTAGNIDKAGGETVSLAETLVVSVIRALIPPHADNEDAARFLSQGLAKKEKKIEWVVVRPDGLIEEENTSEYDIYPSPIRSAIFNAGKTSRINVADFMHRLLSQENLWEEWKGRMPVIYNSE